MNKFEDDLSLEYREEIPSYSEQLDEIMKYFNFDQVKKIMMTDCLVTYDNDGNAVGYHNWKMWDGKKLRIYTVAELRKLAESLLTDVINRGNKREVVWSATGPFKAINRYGILELDFVIESWSID